MYVYLANTRWCTKSCVIHSYLLTVRGNTKLLLRWPNIVSVALYKIWADCDKKRCAFQFLLSLSSCASPPLVCACVCAPNNFPFIIGAMWEMGARRILCFPSCIQHPSSNFHIFDHCQNIAYIAVCAASGLFGGATICSILEIAVTMSMNCFPVCHTERLNSNGTKRWHREQHFRTHTKVGWDKFLAHCVGIIFNRHLCNSTR